MCLDCLKELEKQEAEEMKLDVVSCPTAEDIVAVFEGSADGVTERRVIRHVKNCRSCQEDMQALARSDEAELEEEV